MLAPGRPEVVLVARELGRDVGGEVARKVLPGPLRAHALENELPRPRDRERGDHRDEHRDQDLLEAPQHLDEVRLLGAFDERETGHLGRGGEIELGDDTRGPDRERERARPPEGHRHPRPEHEPRRVAVEHPREEEEEEYEAVEAIVQGRRQRDFLEGVLGQDREGEQPHVDEREDEDEPVLGPGAEGNVVVEPAERDEDHEKGLVVVDARGGDGRGEPEPDDDHRGGPTPGGEAGRGDRDLLEAVGDTAIEALRRTLHVTPPLAPEPRLRATWSRAPSPLSSRRGRDSGRAPCGASAPDSPCAQGPGTT